MLCAKENVKVLYMYEVCMQTVLYHIKVSDKRYVHSSKEFMLSIQVHNYVHIWIVIEMNKSACITKCIGIYMASELG